MWYLVYPKGFTVRGSSNVASQEFHENITKLRHMRLCHMRETGMQIRSNSR